MDCSLSGSSVYGISQARILKWVAISFSRESSQPRDQTHVFCIGRQILYHWATRESLYCVNVPKQILVTTFFFSLQIIFFPQFTILWMASIMNLPYIYSVQFSRSVVSDSLQPHESQHARPLSTTNSWSLLKFVPIESVMPSSHLILCRPLLLLPPIPPSIRVFSNESALRMRRPKYWSFSFSISPSNEHPELISFRMD